MKTARDLIPEIDSVITRQRTTFPEIQDETFWQLYDECKDYSLCHITGFYNTYQSINYIYRNNVKGAFVECGCFLGGMAMFMGRLRQELKLDAEIILFDTFEGPPIGSSDNSTHGQIDTVSLLPHFRKVVEDQIEAALGSLDGYRFVEGLVEDTLPLNDTGPISLLRLDTDFYSSTKIEMDILYPKIVAGGVLIVDDYGLFQGSRQAVDEYFAQHANPPLLNRMDGGVWAGVKPYVHQASPVEQLPEKSGTLAGIFKLLTGKS